jgi:WD40 repeat protein
LKFVNKFKHHLSDVSVIRVSNNGNLVASGDSKKNVFIWDANTKEILIDRFVFHTAKVFDVAWSHDDKLLISGSLDRSVILWNIAEKSKAKVYAEVDNEVIYALAWVGEREFICGGHCCVLKKFNI